MRNNNLLEKHHPFTPTRHKTLGHSRSGNKNPQPFSSVAVNSCSTDYWLCFVLFVRQCGQSAAVSSPLPRKTPQIHTPWALAVKRQTLRFILARQMWFLRYTVNQEIWTLQTVDWWLGKDHTTISEPYDIWGESNNMTWTLDSKWWRFLRPAPIGHENIGYSEYVATYTKLLDVLR